MTLLWSIWRTKHEQKINYTGSRIKQLAAEIGESLLADDVATKRTGGLFGPKTTYIPEKEYKNDVLKGKLEEIKKNPQNTQLAAMINYVSAMTAIMAAVVLTTSLS